MPNSGAPGSADRSAAAAMVGAAPAEHIYLADESGADAAQPQTVAQHFALDDRLRGSFAAVTLYEEGFLDAEERRRGGRSRSTRLDLRYLDPMPSVTRHYARRCFVTAAGAAAAAACAFGLSRLEALHALATPAAFAAGTFAAAALVAGLYASHEKVVFRTLHGRAVALTLRSGLGRFARLRAIVAHIVRAIGEAEEDFGDDTSVFLRAEMREHYRLRAEGTLTDEQCSEGTTRILGHFDDEM